MRLRRRMVRRQRSNPVSQTAISEIKHVPASVASEKYNDIGEQDGQRAEHDHDGRLAHAQRANQKIPEAAGEAGRFKFAGAEQQECGGDAEHGHQREDEADRAGGWSDLASHGLGGDGLRLRSVNDAPWPMRAVKDVVDGCHGRTMRRRLAARWRGVVRICGLFCRLRADAGALLPLPLAGEVDALEERDGWGNSLRLRRRSLKHPHPNPYPNPPPQAGEGAHRWCCFIGAHRRCPSRSAAALHRQLLGKRYRLCHNMAQRNRCGCGMTRNPPAAIRNGGIPCPIFAFSPRVSSFPRGRW